MQADTTDILAGDEEALDAPVPSAWERWAEVVPHLAEEMAPEVRPAPGP